METAGKSEPALNAAASSTSQRVVSIDALRGFDMFWIMGADGLVQGLRRIGDWPAVRVVADQLEHVAWEGFHFYDLIFPLFVFLMGTASVFSLRRIVEQQGKGAAYKRLIRRAVLLYLLGLFYYGGLSRDGGPEMFRYVGVLQRIALCYLFGGLVLLNFRLRGMIAVCATLLLGYWALLAWVPVPGVGAGNFAEGKNLTNYIDQHYLPGYKWDGDWDPEGLLSTLPAVGTAILGIFAGLLLRSPATSKGQRVACLLGLGVAGVALGWLWGIPFPIIKKLWTSSYVLLAGGWSFMLLGLFYLVIDVGNLRLWARPFVWIGMNSITIYMLGNLLNFQDVVRRVIHQPLIDRMAPYGHLVVSVAALSVAVGICGLLYRKKVFLRV